MSNGKHERHDQRTNAYAYAHTGASTVMEEENLKDGLLAAEIARIMGNQEIYGSMSAAAVSFSEQGASTTLTSVLSKIIQEHE